MGMGVGNYIMDKITINKIKNFKNKKPITMITAYDTLFAKIFDREIDIILVGDSLNMSFLGEKDTLSTTIEMMIYHTKAVCRGVKRAFVVTDMPFGSYMNREIALKNATRIYQETEANAVKIEGGEERADIIQTLTSNSIAVLGHIGLMPQFARSEGGYKIKGKSESEIKKLINDAKAIEEAGAFAIVIEGVKSEVAKEVTKTLSIPTIGIGAGVGTDGQVLVWSDMLGFFEDFKPKFVKRYLNGATLVREAVREFVKEVESRTFPSSEYSY